MSKKFKQKVVPAKTRNVRKVAILTPAGDGRVDATYAYALAQTMLLGGPELQFVPVMVCNDALVQRARNDLLTMVVESDCSDAIWIDADIAWDPQWVLRLLSHDVDVVGGTYRHKTDAAETYVMNVRPEDLVMDTRGLIKVNSLGTGFLRMSRKALVALWETGAPYISNGRQCRWAFDARPVDGDLVSEDVAACRVLAAKGIATYLDPAITCNHTGPKVFTGNAMPWLTNMRAQCQK